MERSASHADDRVDSGGPADDGGGAEDLAVAGAAFGGRRG